MEMHHKLRRDPSWDPRGCNLCGQVRANAALGREGCLTLGTVLLVKYGQPDVAESGVGLCP